MDPVGAVIRLSGCISPRARARLELARQRKSGDLAVRLIEELVGPTDVALDVGARWGTYTCLLIRLVGQKGAVHAFEPNPEHTAALRAIARGHRNIRVHSVALSDESGEADLHIPILGDRAADGLASLSRPSAVHHAVRVERRRLDDFRFVRLDFIKCDVEGHELAVLRGAEKTLRQLRPTILIEIEQRHHGADVAATLAFFDRLGYVGYGIHEDGLRPIEEFSLEQHQIEPLGRASGSHWMMPVDYVNDFVFVRGDSDLYDFAGLRSRVEVKPLSHQSHHRGRE